ncbi:hypothetical protein CFBP6411_04819 [Pseudomonas syringae group genomosp. 3]|uniref:Uncharacterized protein n=1 Tax=Pseudomonas syringae group genomosp. 3 TaxID=251701 RepID=A0A2K4WJW7_9PSED|nr:hypothetical protein CFBP6411_04819 [Pseudomonas syringae group genomosp. 3]
MTGKHNLSVVTPTTVPMQVLVASRMEWGVIIDAFLTNAARVGDRYAAESYFDRSGAISDGMTVVTPPVVLLLNREGFLLVRSACRNDHYVIVSEHGEG